MELYHAAGYICISSWGYRGLRGAPMARALQLQFQMAARPIASEQKTDAYCLTHEVFSCCGSCVSWCSVLLTALTFNSVHPYRQLRCIYTGRSSFSLLMGKVIQNFSKH